MSASGLILFVLFIVIGSIGVCGIINAIGVIRHRKQLRKEGWKW